MNSFTQEFIFALKDRTDVELYDCAVDFMAKSCECPRENYTPYMMYKIVKEKFIDYMSTCDYPTAILYDFFGNSERSNEYYFTPPSSKKNFSSEKIIMNNINAMLFALQDTQVKEKNQITGEYYYINGFTD